MILLALRLAGAILSAAAITVAAVCLSHLPAAVDLTLAVSVACAWTNWLDRHDSW